MVITGNMSGLILKIRVFPTPSANETLLISSLSSMTTLSIFADSAKVIMEIPKFSFEMERTSWKLPIVETTDSIGLAISASTRSGEAPT